MENAQLWSIIGTKSVYQMALVVAAYLRTRKIRLVHVVYLDDWLVVIQFICNAIANAKFDSSSRDMHKSGFTRFHSQQKEILSRPLSIVYL